MSYLEDLTPASGYFTPDAYKHAAALLVEPKSHNPAAPPGPQQTGTRPITVADVTVFNTMEDVQAGTPSSVILGTQITSKFLALDTAPLVDRGRATVTTLLKESLQNGKTGWKWRKVDPAVTQLVAAYIEKRDAAVADTSLDSI